MGTLNLRIPKPGTGSFFLEGVLGRHRRVDRPPVAAAAEMHTTGTSTRKAQRAAEKMGVSRLSKDQVSAIAPSQDADRGTLRKAARRLAGALRPARRDLRQVLPRGARRSIAVATAIGCDAGGWRRVLGVDVVDTES